MPHKKKVREIMIPLQDYPHIPYWFTLRQAVGLVRESAIKYAGVFEPRSVLVFNEKYQIVGILTLRDIIKGLEPGFLKESELIKLDPALAVVMEDLLGPAMERQAERPVGEVMSPIKVSVKADDSLVKALFLMVRENVGMMPVMEDDRVVGMLRLTDLFMEVSQALMEKTAPKMG
ncbi:MAG: CBS domain-containing protein [Deltaproteobacteria bacterium]|nr:CBS domain-containing protein [Deltaproteobacteria bacterium]MBW1990712.1 CBS domain-containing protein [Deltaproteobacteria bacterium]